MTFGLALEELRKGKKVARKCWNSKNMWLVFVSGSVVTIRENTPYYNAGLRGEITVSGHIDMFTTQGTMQPGWLASQADILADDWFVVEE